VRLRLKPEDGMEWNDKDCFDSPRRSSVFPDPSFPQMRDSSPGGNLSVRSMRMNLYLGVEATDGRTLEEGERSCGQVTVQD
jgi:hypothetical protein